MNYSKIYNYKYSAFMDINNYYTNDILSQLIKNNENINYIGFKNLTIFDDNQAYDINIPLDEKCDKYF